MNNAVMDIRPRFRFRILFGMILFFQLNEMSRFKMVTRRFSNKIRVVVASHQIQKYLYNLYNLKIFVLRLRHELNVTKRSLSPFI